MESKRSEYRTFKHAPCQFLFQSTDDMLEDISRFLDVECRQSDYENDFFYFDCEPRTVLTGSDVKRLGISELLGQEGF